MGNINDFFPASGDWLKVADLKGRAIKVVVESIKQVQVPNFNNREQLDPALELAFVGAQKTFICKKMNAQSIAVAYGEDWDGWVGQEIVLKPGRSSNGNDMIIAEGVMAVQSGFNAPPRPTPNQSVGNNFDHPDAAGIDDHNPGEPDNFEDDIPF